MKPLLTLIVAAALLAGCSQGAQESTTTWVITVTDKNGKVEQYTAADYMSGDTYLILYDQNGHKKAEIHGKGFVVKATREAK